MNSDSVKYRLTRKLRQEESIPYGLLLLAEETKEAIDKYINDSEIYVLENENDIIAIYVLKPINKKVYEIKYIAVDENFQGKGIGKFLLKDATKRAQKSGFKTIIIGTGDAAIKQLYLYQKEGFRIYDICYNFFIDNYPEPIYENGILCKHMVMLKKEL
jgi:aminoglycoside 6'-N-acetyltransferase I